MTNTGTPVSKGDKITAEKINKKLETTAESIYDASGIRVFDSVYQNTDPKRTLMAHVTVKMSCGKNESIHIASRIAQNTPPTITKHQVHLIHSATAQISILSVIPMFVPPLYYYQLILTTEGAPQPNIIHWEEILL